jgi:lipid A 4'-phosphatase
MARSIYRSPGPNESSDSRNGLIATVALILGLVILSRLAVILDLDRTLARPFYDPHLLWELDLNPFIRFLDEYGPLPGVILGAGSLVLFVISRYKRVFVTWRPYLALIVLTTFLGPGIVVNVIFKDNWGRPRPREVVEFGGPWEYREFYQPGIPGRGKSFPSGHVSAGFTMVTFFMLRRKLGRWAFILGGAGLAWGVVISCARMLQGAHFFTDCLWSFGLVTLTALFVQYVILKPWPRWKTLYDGASTVGRTIWKLVLFGLTAYLALLFFFTRPFYQTHFEQPALTDDLKQLTITLNVPLSETEQRYDEADTIRLKINSRGMGWSDTDIDVDSATRFSDGHKHLEYRLTPEGHFDRLTFGLEIILPDKVRDRLDVIINDGGG